MLPRLYLDPLPDVAVEVAIGAFREAEWPVDVKRELIGFGHKLLSIED
jgi:hypothetical protein